MRQTVIYKKGENFTLEADYYGTSPPNAPVIIYIHGGGLLWGSKEEPSKEMIQYYTTNGFGLFSINYRLAPETKLPHIIEDIQDAIHWIELEGPKQFSINAKRIAVMGSSAGGFLALCTGTFLNKPQAIVSFSGYGDIAEEWATNANNYYCQKDIVTKEVAKSLITNTIRTNATIEERFLLYLYARQTGDWIQTITGTNPTSHLELLKKFCPIHHVTADYPPTLLLHGTNDMDVPYMQSVFMRAAIIRKNVKAKLITIPNGEHAFEKDFQHPSVQNAFHEVVTFLQIYLAKE